MAAAFRVRPVVGLAAASALVVLLGAIWWVNAALDRWALLAETVSTTTLYAVSGDTLRELAVQAPAGRLRLAGTAARGGSTV